MNARDARMATPLHEVVVSTSAYSQAVVDVLLFRGADVNARNSDGDTPLNLAMRANRESVVNKLLHHGASMGLPDNNGKTAMDIAREEFPDFLPMFEEAVAAEAVSKHFPFK